MRLIKALNRLWKNCVTCVKPFHNFGNHICRLIHLHTLLTGGNCHGSTFAARFSRLNASNELYFCHIMVWNSLWISIWILVCFVFTWGGIKTWRSPSKGARPSPFMLAWVTNLSTSSELITGGNCHGSTFAARFSRLDASNELYFCHIMVWNSL